MSTVLVGMAGCGADDEAGDTRLSALPVTTGEPAGTTDDPVPSTPSTTAAATATAEAGPVPDPAALTGDCMARRGHPVTVGSSSVDYSGLDQTDPAVVAAIENCEAEVNDAMLAAAGLTDAEPVGIDEFTTAMFSCMEARGYHPTVGEPQVGETIVGGVRIDYPDAEDTRPTFAEDEATCAAEAGAGPRTPGP